MMPPLLRLVAAGRIEFFIAIGNRNTEAKPMGHAGLLGSLQGKSQTAVGGFGIFKF